MLKIEKTEVLGWEQAIRGMRNPMNSWNKSDSLFVGDDGDYYTISGDFGPWPDESYVNTTIGPNDHDLMMRLVQGGPVHAKYRRMIVVYVDITAPLYWWKEFDTYKVGTVANSCSTMHKIQEKEFVIDDFSHEHLVDRANDNAETFAEVRINNGEIYCWPPANVLDLVIEALNQNRKAYLDSQDKKYWWQMIQLLPSSYNQKRTVMMNYEVLAGIYPMRKSHKLDEWRTFCDWVESLPYSELITGVSKENLLKTPNEIRAEHGLSPVEDSVFRAHYHGKPIKLDTFITDHDRLVISAYTGFLMCDFGELHEFIEKTLGRPVFMHELADTNVTKAIHKKLKDEWYRICGKKEKSNDQFESFGVLS